MQIGGDTLLRDAIWNAFGTNIVIDDNFDIILAEQRITYLKPPYHFFNFNYNVLGHLGPSHDKTSRAA